MTRNRLQSHENVNLKEKRDGELGECVRQTWKMLDTLDVDESW